MTALQPIAAGLWSEDSPPHLIGGVHRQSGRVCFPMPQGQDASLFDAIDLPREGQLWSWTTQEFEPKRPPYGGPETFEPYLVGYVELPGAIIVESRIVGAAAADMQIGMPLTLQIVDFGRGRSCFAFAPSPGARASGDAS